MSHCFICNFSDNTILNEFALTEYTVDNKLVWSPQDRAFICVDCINGANMATYSSADEEDEEGLIDMDDESPFKPITEGVQAYDSLV